MHRSVNISRLEPTEIISRVGKFEKFKAPEFSHLVYRIIFFSSARKEINLNVVSQPSHLGCLKFSVVIVNEGMSSSSA